MSRPSLPKEVVGDAQAILQLRDEVVGLTGRLDQHLDNFGDPPGWVPNLTLTGVVGAYDAVRDIALKELYGAYYLEKMWKKKQDRSDALKQLIAVLIEKTRQTRAQMIDTRSAIMKRGYVPPADPTAVRTITVDDLGGRPRAKVSYSDMSLIEKLRSLIAQMEDLDDKRKDIERRLKREADKKTIDQLQWEAVQGGLKISGAMLKALPLPPPYEQAASAFGGLLEVTSVFMEKGGDNEAFANLKTAVTDFTDANEDKLVTLFTQGMDEELSATNEDIKHLETAAKDTKKARDDLKAEYDSAASAAAAVQEARVKVIEDREQQLRKQREPAPDPSKESPESFKTKIAKRALEFSSNAESTRNAEEYERRKTELESRNTAIEKKTEELQTKVVAITKAKTERAQSTKDNIERAKKLVDGIEKIAKAVNKLTVSETQVNAKWDEALAKIKLEDPEFQAYVAQIAYLTEQKKLVVGRLVKLLNDLQDQRQQIARNLVTINELRTQYAKSGVDDLDHGTLVYVQAMRQDAHRRLTTFLYFVTKAYEYYTVSAYEGFYADAQRIFEDLRTVLDQPVLDLETSFDPKDPKEAKDAKEKQLKKLITEPSGPDLPDSDWQLLKGVYEKPLRDMGSRMLEKLITRKDGKIDEREQHVTLRADELKELNSRIREGKSAHMTLNLARLNQIASSHQKQRLGGFKVVNAVGSKLGERYPDDITFKVTHLGKSIVRCEGRFYAFEPQAGNEALVGSRGVTFETSGSPTKGTRKPDGTLEDDGKVTFSSDALKQPDSKAQETLVSKLLGPSASGNIDLSEFRPGVFSDFLFTVEFTPRDFPVEFSEIEFVVTMEKGNTDSAGALISVFNNHDLAIEIRMSRPDRSERSAGIGRYIGVYNGTELETNPVVVTVPGQYGDYRHTGWVGGTKLVSDGDHSRKISAGTRVIAVYERV